MSKSKDQFLGRIVEKNLFPDEKYIKDRSEEEFYSQSVPSFQFHPDFRDIIKSFLSKGEFTFDNIDSLYLSLIYTLYLKHKARVDAKIKNSIEDSYDIFDGKKIPEFYKQRIELNAKYLIKQYEKGETGEVRILVEFLTKDEMDKILEAK